MSEHYNYCLGLIRQSDRNLYASLLFLPKELRASAAAIYAFDQEIIRIPHLVSEPMTGEIRMEWWREVIEGKREGEGLTNPVGAALLETIGKYELPRERFERYIEARLFDLYNDPMPDMTALEAYCGETDSFLLHMISKCSGLQDSSDLADACGHGGVAIGISKIIQNLPRDSAQQKVYVPVEYLKHRGLSGNKWFAPFSSAHKKTIVEFAKIGDEHLHLSRQRLGSLDKSTFSIFLPFVYHGLVLHNSSSKGNNLVLPETINPLRAQLALWKSVLFHKI